MQLWELGLPLFSLINTNMTTFTLTLEKMQAHISGENHTITFVNEDDAKSKFNEMADAHNLDNASGNLNNQMTAGGIGYDWSLTLEKEEGNF